jgi:hypothetical protein
LQPAPTPISAIHNNFGYVPFLSLSISSLYVAGKLTYLSQQGWEGGFDIFTLPICGLN